MNQDYVNSMNVWFENMEVGFKHSQNIISSLTEQIEIDKQRLELEKAQLKSDQQMYDNAKIDFQNYLEANKE